MFLQNIKQACDIYGKIKKVIIIGGPEAPGRYILPPSQYNSIIIIFYLFFLAFLASNRGLPLYPEIYSITTQ